MRAGRARRRTRAWVLPAVLGLLTCACHSPARSAKGAPSTTTSTTAARPTTTTAPPAQGALVVEARTEAQLSDNFNPFDTAAPLYQMGVPAYVYEPLVQYSELQADQYYPWLASSWSFSSSGLTITFNLRPKVTWADGSAFTAADVAYTFSLLKANPGAGQGIPIVSAQATGPATFVLTLSRPGYAYLYNIAHVPIVKAGYATGARLDAYVDRRPDGTGPYWLASADGLTSRQVTLTARSGYWQGPPPLRRLVFPAFPTRAAVLSALQQGRLDWAGESLGADAESYLGKDKVHNHIWAPAVGSVALELNLTNPAFDDLDVREAVSDALDRAALSRQMNGSSGGPVASLSGLVLPKDNRFLVASDTNDVPPRPEPAAVSNWMTTAGYHLSKQGYWTSPVRGRLRLDIEDPAGSALASTAALVAQQLQAAGFDASASTPPAAKWRNDLVHGDFEASVLPSARGPSPYYMFEQWLDPKLVVNGLALSGNYERFGLATAPQAAVTVGTQLMQFADSLSGSSAAVSAVQALGELVAGQLPVIPLVYSIAWGEFSTVHATGWPDEEDPYEPASPRGPFAEYTVLQLSPVATP